MDWEKLKKEKEDLIQKEKDLNLKKRLLIEQEKKLKIKRYIQIGELFEKAGIAFGEQDNEALLLGALIEVEKLLKNQEQLSKLKKQGEDSLRSLNLRYAISFRSPPPEKAQKMLEDLKFKWRSALQEWHGRAKLNDLNEFLEGSHANIRVIK